jgi:hypothetical protein
VWDKFTCDSHIRKRVLRTIIHITTSCSGSPTATSTILCPNFVKADTEVYLHSFVVHVARPGPRPVNLCDPSSPSCSINRLLNSKIHMSVFQCVYVKSSLQSLVSILYVTRWCYRAGRRYHWAGLAPPARASF